MKTTVVSVKQSDYDIYIGRTSKWGNPFRIGPDGTREEVIKKYRAYIQTRFDLLDSLSELQGKRLGCHCAPLACHGDVLAELADTTADYTVVCDGGNDFTGRYKLTTRDGRQASRFVTLKSDDSPHTAEYKALLAALDDLISRIALAHKDPHDFTVGILTKSELVVEQLAGHYKVKAISLFGPHQQAKTLLSQFQHVVLTKTTRDEITAAFEH